MMGDTSTETSQEAIGLRTVWQLLSVEEQLEFWKYAGQHARDLSHDTAIFRKLCAAIRDAESNKPGGRPTRAIRGAVRPLSSDDLRLGIGRLKGRLLDQPNAQPFLIGAFCSWIQDSRREALNAVLDAVDCPRDERGTLKGVVPPFTPDDALRDICALAPVNTSHTLALVCGALMLNRDLWSGLSETFKALPNLEVPSIRSVPPMEPPSSQAPEQEETTTSDPPSVQSITIEALKAIRDGLDLLGQHLAVATTDISADKVPDLHAAIECWSSVCKQHGEAERALGVSSTCVGDLEAALARQSEMAIVASELARCHSIVHVADSNFAGCAVIRAKCDELKAIAEARQALASTSARAVSALLQLVESGDDLDDEQATHLRIEVEELFGRSVATAALRGKLAFEASILRPDRVAEPFAEAGPTPRTIDGAQECDGLRPSPMGGQLALVSSEALPELATIAAPEAKSLEVPDERTPTELSPVQAEGSEPTETSPTEAGGAGVVAGGEAPFAIEEASGAPAKAVPPSTAVEVIATPAYEPFTSFCSTHWVDASGSVVLAPWKAEGFVPALAKRAQEAWELGQSAIAYLLSATV